MRSVLFLALLSLVLPANSSKAQGQSLPLGLKPRVGVTILADGKPATQQTGVKAHTKEIRFKALLDTRSNDFFNDFQSEVIIKNAEVILANNGRQIARTDVTGGNLVIDLDEKSQLGDHIIFKFTLMAQRKNGELVLLPDEPIYKFLIRQ